METLAPFPKYFTVSSLTTLSTGKIQRSLNLEGFCPTTEGFFLSPLSLFHENLSNVLLATCSIYHDTIFFRFIRDDWLLPFGIGRRYCMGEQVKISFLDAYISQKQTELTLFLIRI